MSAVDQGYDSDAGEEGNRSKTTAGSFFFLPRGARLGELDWDLKFGQDFVMLPWDSE